nr:Uncharacterised protein [Raoultella sp. NCTC 9187]
MNAGSLVKNHTFFGENNYSLRVMIFFLSKLVTTFPLIYINLLPPVTPNVSAGYMNNQRYI